LQTATATTVTGCVGSEGESSRDGEEDELTSAAGALVSGTDMK